MSFVTDPPSPAGGPVPLDRRTVTVLFADLVRSTHLIARLDAEDALAVLGPALAAMTRAVQRYAGTVCKPLGDGVMAMFGAPMMQEDHALRACHAALAMQEQIIAVSHKLSAEYGLELKLRIGLTSGPVVITAATDGGATTYDAVGATVHLASRMQSAAAPGTICLSESCWRRVHQAFACRALGTKAMKGFHEAQPVYELLHATPRQDAGARYDYRPAGPLIGRVEPLAAVEGAVADVAAGNGGLLLLVGEAGIGKSRLLAEARHLAPEGLQWFEGQSPSFAQRISYWPFIEMLQPLLEPGAKAGEGENWAVLEARAVALFAEEAHEVLPYVAALVGMEVRAPYDERVRHLEAEALGAQILRAAWRWFEALSRRQPLVIALEDVHWADRSTLALVEHLAPLAASAPILFLVVSRPDPDCLEPLRALGARILAGHFTELSLSPLSPAEGRALMASTLGDDPRTRRIQEVILAKADGNPFFIEEVMRTLIDTRVLVPGRTPGGWSVQGQDIVIPDTIEGVVMARVDRLDDRLKEVLSIAAIVGRSFLYRVLRAVTSSDTEIDAPLARLAAIAFVEEMRAAPELAYLFKHALAHEAIYGSMLHDKRRRLHARVAQCLERLYADRMQLMSGVLAFHYARAELWPKALHYLLEAANASSQIAADDEALAHYEDAVAAYGRAFAGTWDRVQRATIDRRLGEIHLRRGNHALAEEHLTRALAFFGDRLPTWPLAIRAAIAREIAWHAILMLAPGVFAPALHVESTPEIEARLRPYEALGWVSFLADQERLLLMILRVANLAQRTGVAELVAKTQSAIGFGLDGVGARRVARRYHRRAVAIAERFDLAPTLAFARNMHALHHFFEGRWPEAEAGFLSALDAADKVGDLVLWADAGVLLCELWNETGDFDRALALADEMIKRGREAALQPALRWGLASRGKALRRQGRAGEGRVLLEEAVALSLGRRDLPGAASAAAELGLLLLDDGDIDAAGRLLASVERDFAATRMRVYTVGALHVAVACCALRRLAQAGGMSSPALLGEARRAAARALRSARRYGVSLPGALRIRGTLAGLQGRRAPAERYWRRAMEVAERYGAQVELALIRREFYADPSAPAVTAELADPAFAGRKPGPAGTPPP